MASSATSEHVTASVGTTEDVPANVASANYVATTKGGTTAKGSETATDTSANDKAATSRGHGVPPAEESCREFGCGRFGPPTSASDG
jgi:hypothetical protein